MFHSDVGENTCGRFVPNNRVMGKFFILYAALWYKPDLNVKNMLYLLKHNKSFIC